MIKYEQQKLHGGRICARAKGRKCFMKRKLYYPVLSAAICAGLLFPAIGAIAATDPARACYSDYLNRNLATRYNSYGYDIVDINGDGTPELLFTQMIGGKSYLYTYNAATNTMKKLKAAKLGKSSPIMYYSTKKHQVCFVQGDTGGYSYTVWQYKGKKIKKKYKIRYYNGRLKKQGYRYNGNAISLSKGKKKVKKITKSFQSLRYTNRQ